MIRLVGVELALQITERGTSGVELSSWLCQSQSMSRASKLVAMWHIQNAACEMINCNCCTNVTIFRFEEKSYPRFCFQLPVSLHGFSHSNSDGDFAVDMRVRVAEAHWASAEMNTFCAILHHTDEKRSTSTMNTDVTYMETKRSWSSKCENGRDPKSVYKETEFDVRKRNTAESKQHFLRQPRAHCPLHIVHRTSQAANCTSLSPFQNASRTRHPRTTCLQTGIASCWKSSALLSPRVSSSQRR